MIGEEEKKKVFKNVFEEIMVENFPNLNKKTNIQVPEAQRIPNMLNPKRFIPRQIIIKIAKVREDSKDSKRKTKSIVGEPQ